MSDFWASLHFQDMNNKILILGFGNPDREDDGVAWHVLTGVAEALGMDTPSTPDDEFPQAVGQPDFLFMLQLVPEIAETLAEYDAICFVDAHTGAIEKSVNVIEIDAQYQNSPFTHHLTPQSCLELTKTLYGKKPISILVSIRGYQFGFHQTLSEGTKQHAKEAIRLILNWLQTGTIDQGTCNQVI